MIKILIKEKKDKIKNLNLYNIFILKFIYLALRNLFIIINIIIYYKKYLILITIKLIKLYIFFINN